MDHEFKSSLKKRGITHEVTMDNSPESNWKAENPNRALLGISRTIMTQLIHTNVYFLWLKVINTENTFKIGL